MVVFLGKQFKSHCRSALSAAAVAFLMVATTPCLSDTDALVPSVSEGQDPCVFGFTPHAVENNAVDYSVAGQIDSLVHSAIRHWMAEHRWQRAYNMWQNSRRCGEGFAPKAECRIRIASVAQCSGRQDGYDFLVMHHHLLVTLKSLWPEAAEQFSGWPKFPIADDDYPEILRDNFYAWPDEVRRAAHRVDSIGKMSLRELRLRWRDEGEFGQWLQCGTVTSGMGVDGLYGALRFNGESDPIDRLDAYLFWQTQGWIDKAWKKYRKAIGKTPDDPELQADLIAQCHIMQFWAGQAVAKPIVPPIDQGLQYVNGHLNGEYRGKAVRLLGEVVEIKSVAGRVFYQLNVKLKGVNPVWVLGYVNVAEGEIHLGDRLVFIGYVRATHRLDADGEVAKVLQTPGVLVAESIQTPK